jgi:hypothetical protein
METPELTSRCEPRVERVRTEYVASAAVHFTGDVCGSARVDTFRSVGCGGSGGVVVQIRVVDGQGAQFPHALRGLCDGVELQFPGQTEANALLKALKHALELLGTDE